MYVPSQGSKKVEALILDEYPALFRSLTNEEFGQLPKLRYLQVYRAGLTGDFKHLPSELRWFEWHGVDNFVNFALTSFHLKNLVILHLSRCVIKDDTWSEMKMPQKLKVLDLSFVYGFRRLPNLSINLREPRVSSCTSITELPNSIGNLEKLEQIHIYGCHNLKGEIPWSIGRLFSLRILLLYDTGICSLPTSVFGLSHLQTLHLWRCDELELLPELSHSLTDLAVSSGLTTTFPSLSNLVNLKKLYFSLRNNPIEIPRDIGKLSKLETLIFFESNIINSLPAEIGALALSQLKILEVKLCSSIRFILGLASSLFKLHLYHCYSLERLPDLSNLKNLSTLKLRQCLELKGIQGLEQLESLRYLDVSVCELVERLLDL